MKSERELYRLCAEKYGAQAQWDQMQEECAEVIAKINQVKRGRYPISALAEEVADVEIVTAQARMFLGDELVDAEKSRKLARLERRLDDHVAPPPHEIHEEELCNLINDSCRYDTDGHINTSSMAKVFYKFLEAAGYNIKKKR